MEAVKLPTENAHEPVEEARQPPCDVTMSSQEPSKPKNRHATFADDVTTTQKELSQSSSAYKEALSQPGPGLSHRHRLAWLQRRRGPGLWVQCDSCESWRHLPHVVDAHQLPPKWYCSMNPEKSMANCSVPEAPLRVTDEEDLIHSEYSAGSLVWARLPGWPWWPAMVDDCPDTEQFYWLDGFSDIPTYYNVVFFDATDVTRAWIAPENLKPFTLNKSKQRHALKDKKYKKRLETAMKQAEKAEKLPVLDRLAEFSFISTYKGAIVSPRKVTKRELERFQIQLQKKFNVDFPIEVSSETDDEVQTFRENNKRKNVIIIGTPKTKKTKRARITNDDEDNAAIKTGDNDNEKHNKNNDEKTKNNKQKIETIIATPNTPMRKKEMKGACNKKPKNIVNDILTEIPENPDSEITISEKTVTAPNTVNENETSEPSTNGVSLNTFKHPDPDSMAIEVGSTQTLNWTGIDNDSSKTYLPEDKTDSVVDTQDFQIRINSPSSDDFDF